MKNKALVLLAAYNGAEFVEEQLNSIFLSRITDQVSVAVGLDPSTDNTKQILLSYNKPLDLIFHEEPSGGAAQNFSRLMVYAKTQDVDYFLLADQDDYWSQDKIQLSLNKLKEMEGFYGSDVPLLLFTDAEVVRRDLSLIAPSFWKHEGLDVSIISSYKNLIAQNVGQGCTFAFNRALLEKVGEIPLGIRMHDHWIMLVASVFGRVGYLDRSTLKYRQHERNVVGSQGSGLVSAFRRLIFGRERIRNAICSSQKQALIFIEKYGPELDLKKLEFIGGFAALGSRNFIVRKFFCAKNFIRMASFYRTVGLYLFI